MKIALFGGSGRTGKEILIQSLVKGYKVRAMVRNLEAIDITDDKLQVLQGDILNPMAVENAVMGSDVVMVALGVRSSKDQFVLSQGTQHIVEAMDKFGVKRIIVESSTGIFGAKDGGFIFGNIIRPLFLKKIFDDKLRQLEILKKSDLEWVLVRPSGLIDAQKTGKYNITDDKPSGRKIARSDVAEFMLAQINGSKYIRQMPIISY